MITRVLICGGRDFSDRDYLFESLDSFLLNYDAIEIVSGHANGADKLGEEYAMLHGYSLKVFKAEWSKYGRAAGPVRNKQMLQYILEANPVIIAFWDRKSRGTKNMIDQGRKAGVEVHVFSYPIA